MDQFVVAVLPRLPPPMPRLGAWAWLRREFLSGPVSIAMTLLLVAGLVWLGPGLLRWAVTQAVLYTPDPAVCRAAAGACWAVIGEKWRVMLFATYPYDQQWRGGLVVALLAGMTALSTVRSLWSTGLLAAWVAVIVASLILQMGGILGLSYVPTGRWGGLPLTVMLFVGTVALGLPFAVALALGRRSTLPAVRGVSRGYVEVVRGLPLVNVLFMASLLVPLFLPEGMNPDKLLRAQLGMAIFFAAYAAEAVRGGLQALPGGQEEAARALGLGAWARTTQVVLPQALRIAVPALANDVIRAFKNTSLLVVIGLFDVLGGTMAALEDPAWSRFYVEGYLFVALLYFVICAFLSFRARRLETDLAQGRNF
ncbi:MAG: transporter permease [Rubritepida sp.]|nr:transporter permease [Rubritepida sp.]